MRPQPRLGGFGTRLLAAQGLVIVAGTASLLGVALTVAPVLFHRHLGQVAGPIPDDVARHVDLAFSRAILFSLGLAVAAASITALLVGLFVTRRVLRPIRAMASAAELITAGDYASRIPTARLGSEFARLEHAFNTMAANLAATERTRAEILRDLAHEFRTPLTTVRGYTEAIADGVMPPDSETSRTIEAELVRLERLVHDIALVSSAEERHLNLARERTRAAEILADAANTARAAFTGKRVVLAVETDKNCPDVSVDRDRIQEVLANLLDNALRHTPEGGEVRLAARPRGDSVELAVADTGEGIAGQHLSRVFERFYRVGQGRSREQGGSGIGLAIARALVQAHGGHIRAQSAGPGEGSIFTITLPTAD